MNTPTRKPLLAALAIAALALPALAAIAGTDAEDRRDADEKASKQVLKQLFAACPGAKAMLRASEGYATFAGVGSGAGSGIARPTRTRQPVYMRFESSGQAAASGRDLVFVFSTRDDFSTFAVKGATLGGDAAKSESAACGQDLAPGIRVIQVEGKQVVLGAVPTAHYSQASLH